MGTHANYLGALSRIQQKFLEDAVTSARRLLTKERMKAWADDAERTCAMIRASEPDLEKIRKSWPPLPSIEHPDLAATLKLLERPEDDPCSPRYWQRRLVEAQLAKPEAAATYMKIRHALWRWEEFASIKPGARRILEVVIELARDEAFPWYLAVPAQEVRRLARLTEGSYARSIRELECLSITRPGRVLRLADSMGMPVFPGTVDETKPPEPIGQFVVRYRRGIPWNKKSAAWWINYDLLCATGRVLPCFVVNLRTLSKTYQSRNKLMGPWTGPSFDKPGSEGFRALEEALARTGPPLGLRAALWNGLVPGSEHVIYRA